MKIERRVFDTRAVGLNCGEDLAVKMMELLIHALHAGFSRYHSGKPNSLNNCILV